MHKKLFIPGPVDVLPEVLERMATPMIGHRSKEASALQRSISEKMMKLMYTQNQIMLSTTSGTGLMEGAIRSCTRKRAAVFSVGAFGKRWYELATGNQVPADLFESEPGHPTTPERVDAALATGKYDLVTITHNETSTGLMNAAVDLAEVIRRYPEVVFAMDTVSSLGGTKIEVDALGVDICITSTQKALGLPPGLAICSFSEKAVAAARQVEHRGYYLDLLSLYDYIQKKDHQYPSTPSLSHMYALDYQLDRIFEEGPENRFSRHKEMADLVQTWAEENFALFPQKPFASHTLTTIRNTREINIGDLNKRLGEKGYAISNGYGNLKEKTFRIAHMADRTVDEVKELLQVIESILP